MNNLPSISETSTDSKLIYERLIISQPGDVITYQELNDLTGRNIQKHRYLLATARKMAEREKLMQFDAVSKIGIKRLADDEIVTQQSVKPFRQIRSATRRSARALSCANDISNESRINKNAALSLLGTIATFVAPSAIEKVAMQTITAEIGTGKVMEMFK